MMDTRMENKRLVEKKMKTKKKKKEKYLHD